MQPKAKDYVFQSGISSQINAFLNEKFNLGYKYDRVYLELMSLDRFLLERGCNDALTQGLALEWVERKPHHKPLTTEYKINILQQLADFMLRNGFNAYRIPQNMIPQKTYEHIPYIFSRNEISRILQAIDNTKYSYTSRKRHLVFPLLYRFLYCCGLRVTEALTLKYGDIDFENNVVTIRSSKSYTDRLIPLDDSLKARVLQYRNDMKFSGNSGDHFFPAPDGLQYHIFTIRNMFRKYLWEAGIPYRGRNHGPRLHDLRHTFAVHSYQKMISEGRDPNSILPLLAAYLGHKNYTATSRYLHLAAESYPEIISQSEAAFGNLIPPEVTL